MGNFYKQMQKLYNMTDFSWAADNASRPGTMAAYMDRLITSSDRIEEIVWQVADESRKRGHRMRYTEGIIHSHIKFRIQQAATNKSAK